jgi:hypothetical protein
MSIFEGNCMQLPQSVPLDLANSLFTDPQLTREFNQCEWFRASIQSEATFDDV